MQNSRIKGKTLVIAIVVLLMTSAILMDVTVQPVQAQLAAKQPYSGPLKTGDIADGTFHSEITISARPKLVGIGQEVLVNMWVTPAAAAGRKLLGYQVTITKPDGTTDQMTLDSERDTAATWFDY